MKIENDNSQLTIEMPKRTALDREDFLVNARNKSAVEFIDNFYKEPIKQGILIGPKGCGKTHLVNVLCKSLEGINWSFLSSENRDIYNIFNANDVIIIEDINNFNSKQKEDFLFHSINLSKELRKALLLTSSIKVSKLNFKTLDLVSRLEAMNTAFIEEEFREGFQGIIPNKKLEWTLGSLVLAYHICEISKNFEVNLRNSSVFIRIISKRLCLKTWR